MGKKIMPYIFSHRDCPICGAKDSIMFVDIYNNYCYSISNINKNGTYKAICQNCNREYIILWNEDKYQFADKDYHIKTFEKEFINNEKRSIDDVLFADL